MKNKKHEMRTVLITIYLLTMGVALIVGFIIFGKINGEVYTNQSKVETIKKCHNLKSILEHILDNPIYITSEIAMNTQIQVILEGNKETSKPVNVYEEKAIKDILTGYLPSYGGIRSIHILNTDNQIVSIYGKESEQAYEKQILEDFNEKEVYANKGKDYLDILNSTGGESLESSIYISRAIRSKETLEELGCIVMVLSSDYIRSVTKEQLDYMNLKAVLISEDGDYFEFDNKAGLASVYVIEEIKKNNLAVLEKDDKPYVKIDYSEKNMKLIGGIEDRYMDDLWVNIIIGVVIVNIIFLAFMIILLGKKIVYPLEKIADEAKKITKNGDLSVRLKAVDAYEEIALLGESINEMLTNVESLVNEVKEKERTQRMLELSVINHQVNPHFLYNTLNSVAMLVAMEEKEEAQNLIESLAKYYRACLNQDDLNTVGKEVVILKEYVNIMHIKNCDLLRVEYNIDASLAKKKMPRMILQTLVENSIKYGVKTVEEPLKINVSILRDNRRNCMIVSVRDNGKGMDVAIKNSILQEETLCDKSGFGLKSTIRRIALMNAKCSIEDILEINSEMDKYTEIRVYIPI